MYSINIKQHTWLLIHWVYHKENEGMCSHMKYTNTSVYLSLGGLSNDVICHNTIYAQTQHRCVTLNMD